MGRSACTVAMQHALTESLLVTMEEWAAKQPAALPDALEAVERISELLDLSGLFSALLLHPRRDRKSLSYTGGIRVSGLDFGFPCPYGALESYLTKDGCRVMTRDPGDDLWSQTFVGSSFLSFVGLLAWSGCHGFWADDALLLVLINAKKRLLWDGPVIFGLETPSWGTVLPQ